MFINSTSIELVAIESNSSSVKTFLKGSELGSILKY